MSSLGTTSMTCMARTLRWLRKQPHEHRRGRDRDHHRRDQGGLDLRRDQAGAQGERREHVAELTDLSKAERELQRPSRNVAESRLDPGGEDLGRDDQAYEEQSQWKGGSERARVDERAQ